MVERKSKLRVSRCQIIYIIMCVVRYGRVFHFMAIYIYIYTVHIVIIIKLCSAFTCSEIGGYLKQIDLALESEKVSVSVQKMRMNE